MKNKKLILLIVSTSLLCGCDYFHPSEDFKAYKNKAWRCAFNSLKGYTEYVINGWVQDEGKQYYAVDMKVEKGTLYSSVSEEKAAFMILIKSLRRSPLKTTYSSEVNYSCDDGFKMYAENVEINWDDHLNLTKMKANDSETVCDFTVSWAYKN